MFYSGGAAERGFSPPDPRCPQGISGRGPVGTGMPKSEALAGDAVAASQPRGHGTKLCLPPEDEAGTCKCCQALSY